VVSYAINNNVVQYADGNDDPIPSGFSLSNLAAASHTVLLFEVSGVAANVADLQEGAGDNTTGTNFSASGNGLDNRLYAQKDWSTRVENQYATGYLGGRSPFDPGETQFASPEGRHETGANYLLADGHTRLFFGRQISSGHNAFGENCHQDNIPPLANCGSTFQAAGTADAAFAATFSIQ
jgi:prepilin-type processing-associated H-X9-DG protein